VYVDDGILFSFKKEGNLAICNNMNEDGRYYTIQDRKTTTKKEKYYMNLHVENKIVQFKNTENRMNVACDRKVG
jgi:hypothetical protein